MGYALAIGTCICCMRVFEFNPMRVPSCSAITGQREPICANCVERINPLRIKNGLAPIMPPSRRLSSMRRKRARAMTQRLGDAPIQPEFYEKMNAIAEALDRLFNGEKKGAARPTGFILMVYPFANMANGDARCNYISNGADRKDVVVLMREMIARFEGQPEISGKA